MLPPRRHKRQRVSPESAWLPQFAAFYPIEPDNGARHKGALWQCQLQVSQEAIALVRARRL